MNREESSIFSCFLVFLLIFLVACKTQARKQHQNCSSSCGDIINIKEPFRLKGDPADCGYPEFELSCEENRTILEYNSGKSYVKKISHEDNIISVADVNLANGSCSVPSKSKWRLYTLDSSNFDSYSIDIYSLGLKQRFANFVNCSTNVINQTYIRVPCLSKNQSNVYVNFGGYRVSDLQESCSFISTVPTRYVDVEYPSYENIKRFLELGFDLRWSVECRNCVATGGSCYRRYTSGKFYCENYKTLTISEIASDIAMTIVYFIYPLSPFAYPQSALIIGRFIFAPIVLLGFLIHKYRATMKRVDDVEKFLHNQQSWMPKRYSYAEIMAMTNHFQEKLGKGGFGSVYKGQFYSGHLIAVKMLENSKFSAEEFINEVSTIGRIHHVNVVQLLGFCSEGSKRALVYEFMPNGSLDRHIFSKNGEGQSFSWEKLHEIALGTARGIEYLHRGCDVCILHFDIKPHNILLDHNFIPKVSDFGLAKFHPKEEDFVSVSATRGTIGYIAPELISRNFGTVSCKSDVYSFGMLLLEMAGGRRNSNMWATRSSKAYFPSWVYDKIIKGGDLELRNVTEIESLIARKLCIIGLWCIQVKATDRPTMTKVLEMLEGSIEDLQMPQKPFFSSSSQQISEREIISDSSAELLLSKSIEQCSLNDSFV